MKNKTNLFFAAACLSFLFAGDALAGDPDVSDVFLTKTNTFLQTGTALPVEDGSSPFSIIARVQSSGTGSITSAAFTPPGKSSIVLPGNNGNFFFNQFFSSQGAIDAAMPNGAYQFVIHSADMPGGYDPVSTISGDFPNTPQVLNTFINGNINVNASQDYTLNWNSYNNFVNNGTPGVPQSQIYIQINDSLNNTVFTQSYFNATTSGIIPAGTLLPDKTYTASVTFGEGLASGDGVTSISSEYNIQTNFTVATPTGGVSPDFFVVKAALYSQTGTSGPVLTGTLPYGIFSLLEASAPGSILSGTLTPPGGSPGGSLTYRDTGEGFGNFEAASGSDAGVRFGSIAAMNTSYPSGTYSIAGTAVSGSFSANLLLGGTFSPNTLSITNTNWHGGNLAVSPAAATTLTWNPLSDATAGDGILLQVFKLTGTDSDQNVLQTTIPATSGSFVLPVLAAGAYEAHMSYLKVSGTSASIGGATGYAGFANQTVVSIVSKSHDIIWQNTTSGEVSAWPMNGTTALAPVVITPTAPSAWKVVGTGDFNKDGNTDLVWQNSTTGAVSVWLMSGTTQLSNVVVAASTPTAWKVVGTGDFNKDGNTDLVWQNSTTGAVSVWLMNGTTQTSTVTIAASTPTAWKVVGMGDFNKDGNTDLVWQNSSTGAVSVWLMNGTTQTSAVTVAASTPTAWKVVGAGDFNGDGNPDLLWQNSSTGAVSVWLMNGTTQTSAVTVTASTPLAWRIKGYQ